MRTRSTATALAVLFSSAALAAAPAHADTTQPLPVRSTGTVVVDGVHQRVFLSDPSGGKIVVTDYRGTVVKQLTALPGVLGLELSADSATLYAAVPGGTDAIVAFDTATATESARYPVGDIDPKYPAIAGGRLWFGYDTASEGNGGHLGSVDLTAPEHTVTLGQDPDSPWFSAPMLDGAGDTLVAGIPTQSPSELGVYDVASGTPALTAHRDVDGGNLRDLAVTPDGQRLVVAGGYPYHQAVYSTADLSEDGSYPTAAYPNAVDIAPDGSVAAGIDGAYEPDVYVFKPGQRASVREYDFGASDQLLADAGLVWAPDSSRLFAVSHDYDGAYRLRVLEGPTKAVTKVTADAPATATRAKKLTVKGKVTSRAALPAGTRLTVTRTDLESPKGKALPQVTTKADGSYSFTDTPPAGGKVTYKVSYAGDSAHTAASGSDSATVSRSKASLSLNNNGKVYSYGKDVKFTAHLGKTYKNRTVEIWADPYGADKPNKLVKSGKVNSHGDLAVTLDLRRDTKLTAKFAGDARTATASATSTVWTRVSVSLTTAKQYKSVKAYGQTYAYFHKSTDPRFITKMPYYKGRSHRLDIQVYYQGTWYDAGSEYFGLGTNGVSEVRYTGDHGQEVGYRLRVRSSYVNGSSGDSVNSTTYGSWKYFLFTK
ncbi:Ig-like domain repeat protein [Streptomyces bauhiniae]|uniref:Ig-like domain repeat protein n=1 Tax=Streptomyces bauhiniae TaxID=2340725 RepID=UPI00332F45F8